MGSAVSLELPFSRNKFKLTRHELNGKAVVVSLICMFWLKSYWSYFLVYVSFLLIFCIRLYLAVRWGFRLSRMTADN